MSEHSAPEVPPASESSPTAIPPPVAPPPVITPPSDNSHGEYARMMDAINALPEKMVHAMREAAKPEPPAPKTEDVVSSEKTVANVPGVKSWADWWFRR